MGNLTDMKIRSALKTAGVYSDGCGLYLRVKPSGAASWVLRVQHMGRRLDHGLGGYPADLTLAEAREEAYRLRKLARKGGDVRAAREKQRIIIPSFAEAVEKAHAEFRKGWSDKNAANFKSSLEQHIIPKLGSKRVDQIGKTDVVSALAPIWTEKPEIARKLRVRVAQVLDFAHGRDWRPEGAPVIRAGKDLAKQPRGGNFAAMPHVDVPAFATNLLEGGATSGRLALLFTILTAARSGEVRKANWAQIDLDARTWTRPADLMKSGEKHTVMLSDAAVAILEKAGGLFGREGLVFPGARANSTLSDMTLSKILRSEKQPYTVHGFRSTFRDWASEQMPTIPWNVAEMALAHKVGNAVERSYARSDLRELRQTLADAWGRFVAPSLSASGANVVNFPMRAS